MGLCFGCDILSVVPKPDSKQIVTSHNHDNNYHYDKGYCIPIRKRHLNKNTMKWLFNQSFFPVISTNSGMEKSKAINLIIQLIVMEKVFYLDPQVLFGWF